MIYIVFSHNTYKIYTFIINMKHKTLAAILSASLLFSSCSTTHGTQRYMRFERAKRELLEIDPRYKKAFSRAENFDKASSAITT